MKTVALKIAALGTIIGIPAIGIAQTDGSNSTIQLRIANRACGEVAAGTTSNPNPSDLNDGDLDDAETAAITEGCMFRATVSSPNGMRQSGVDLILRRSAAPHGSFETFGFPRTTDERGDSVWRFQPTPNTDYIYEVVSPNPSGNSATSNTIEIQLCTGSDSVGAITGAPTADAGQGCETVSNSSENAGATTDAGNETPLNP
jgi:hypothetical protein